MQCCHIGRFCGGGRSKNGTRNGSGDHLAKFSRCKEGAGRVQGGCKEGARRVQGGCKEGASIAREKN